MLLLVCFGAKWGINEALKGLGDWRIPAIFAVPVLLGAAVLYLALQPIGGSAVASGGGTTASQTPSGPLYVTPLPSLVQTPYPTAAPLGVGPAYALPCSTGVTQMRASVSSQSGNLVVKVVDQRNRPVVCAWLVPSYVGGPNGYGLGGETDAKGTVAYSLAALPAHFHSVSTVQFDSATTAFDFTR